MHGVLVFWHVNDYSTSAGCKKLPQVDDGCTTMLNHSYLVLQYKYMYLVNNVIRVISVPCYSYVVPIGLEIRYCTLCTIL